MDSLRRTNGGLRCNIIGYIRKKIPLEKGDEHSIREKEREKMYEIVEISVFTVIRNPSLDLPEDGVILNLGLFLLR